MFACTMIASATIRVRSKFARPHLPPSRLDVTWTSQNRAILRHLRLLAQASRSDVSRNTGHMPPPRARRPQPAKMLYGIALVALAGIAQARSLKFGGGSGFDINKEVNISADLSLDASKSYTGIGIEKEVGTVVDQEAYLSLESDVETSFDVESKVESEVDLEDGNVSNLNVSNSAFGDNTLTQSSVSNTVLAGQMSEQDFAISAAAAEDTSHGGHGDHHRRL